MRGTVSTSQLCIPAGDRREVARTPAERNGGPWSLPFTTCRECPRRACVLECAVGTFKQNCVIENFPDATRAVEVTGMLVDTGSEHTWVPAKLLESIGISRQKKDITFVMANGQRITRSVGFAVVRCGAFFTIDEVVFAEEGDLPLLGARSLEGFNAHVDSVQKRLVAAGPVPAA